MPIVDPDHPSDWFEPLYASAQRGEGTIPWDRDGAQPLLVEWANARALDGRGKRAMVIGSGLGQDAEYIASLGFETTAFDISPTAVRTARERHPDSRVTYHIADLLALDPAWSDAFDLVVEHINVQALPIPRHAEASATIGRMVAPGGTLIVIGAIGHTSDDPERGPPWPLKRNELDAFVTGKLRPINIEEVPGLTDPDVRRWRAEFRRAQERNTA